jgi:hypothetical protein
VFFSLDGERKTPSGKQKLALAYSMRSKKREMQGERSSFKRIWTNDDDKLAHLHSLRKVDPVHSSLSRLSIIMVEPTQDRNGDYLVRRMLSGP